MKRIFTIVAILSVAVSSAQIKVEDDLNDVQCTEVGVVKTAFTPAVIMSKCEVGALHYEKNMGVASLKIYYFPIEDNLKVSQETMYLTKKQVNKLFGKK